MRKAAARDPRHELCSRRIYSAVLLLGVACCAALPSAFAQVTTQQAATSQPDTGPHTRGMAPPASQPASTQSFPGVTPTGTATGTQSTHKPTLHAPDWLETFGVVVFFVIMVGVLSYAWKYSRDKALEKLTPDEEEPPFTLEELRQLRDSGKINQEEFLRARAIVLEKERRRLIKDADEGRSASDDKGQDKD
jgi:hypothetical protein